jgi:hypothetical protein
MLSVAEVNMRHLMALAVCTALTAIPLSAAELEGVKMADEVIVDGKTLKLNGLGLREATILMVDVYVAGLYLEQPSSDARAILDSDQMKRIHMHFIYKKVDRKKLVRRWNEGIEANVPNGMKAYSEQLARLNGWMETMAKGDTMTFTAIPGKGLVVEVKGSEKGVIADEQFARDFWAIWLGPDPPNAGLKKGMLGGD